MGVVDTDVFICHSSSDKSLVALPLVQMLEVSGISCWMDQIEIMWGDSLTAKVNEGLRKSRYAIVILSSNFVNKPWPQRELDALLNLEASSGQSKVLPLFVGSEEERRDVIAHYPLMNDKLFMIWPDDSDRLVDSIHALLGRSNAEQTTAAKPRRKISTPTIKREPTELERHRFLQDGFAVIRDYFADGVSQLSEQDNLDAEITDIHATKFVCHAFVSGERKAKCKIWQGGFSDGDHISFSTSFSSIDDDNSYNDWISVSRGNLSWDPGNFGGFGPGTSMNQPLSSEEAAEYFWEQFAQQLSW